MKKREFWFGCAYVLIGVGFFIAFLFTDTKLGSLFCGLAGGMLGTGLGLVGKYVYWTRPKRSEEYAQRLENERIGMKDERLRMIRDRARSHTCTVGLYVITASMLAFCAADAMEIPATWKAVVLYLTAFLALEFTVYVAAFKKLEKQY